MQYQKPLVIFHRKEMSFEDTSLRQFFINRQKPKLFVEYLKKHQFSFEEKSDWGRLEREDLLLGHTEEYLDDFFSKDPRVEASIGIPLSNQYLISCEYETSALYHAINYALQHPKTITHSLVCWVHHAWPTGWRMLCWLNGQVIASCKIYEKWGTWGAYIDLDAHYGNAIDESRGFSEIVDRALPDWANINPEWSHKEYITSLKTKLQVLEMLIIKGKVWYVVYAHGSDSCEWDAFWGHILSREERFECTKIVCKRIKELSKKIWKPIPMILALFGGYRENINEILELYREDLEIIEEEFYSE